MTFKRSRLLMAGAFAAVAMFAWWMLSSRSQTAAPAGALAVAVATVTAARADVPITVRSIGAAQAWQTTVIRPQVNGRLLRVAVREGSEVKAGDLIAEIDATPFRAQVAQAQGALQRDQALMEVARLDLIRYQQLAQKGSIAYQQVDAQEALVKEREGTVLIDQGALSLAQVNLSYCRITSPITGRVGVRLIDSGNLVSTSDVGGIVTINQVVPAAVAFSIPQGDLQRLADASDGFRRKLRTEAFAQDTGTLLAVGELTTSDNHVDPTSGTVQLKARFANTDRKLWPGQFVTIRLTLNTLSQVTTVPSAAVNSGPRGPFVYVVSAERKAMIRPITVSLVQDSTAVITAGVNHGETVVVDGQLSLKEGSTVVDHALGSTPAQRAP